ncbi:methyltransferase domain protein [Rickettsia parkeri str. Tate's Hell]|uniref:Methyltransferase domain protein n=1 Tax=Rickettsia parkeri str. Tate's Hell TaxID=1359189 RepID=A0ABR5DN40_RICPA|nr:class I SAM-dependent methyltransferase [Rickettsia parkeri]AFC74231.1 Putative methyltransferase [Rickettsia parkeri str. Portsmouth]KJV93520.1 methyltransferase domain protein [Rickettsia parkeri str. Grand Bay]KJV95485.1 methyltransferase domain protein [Rickettsia parkeri str. AT\
MTKQANKISYDEVPYSPFTFSYTSPPYLRTIGKLFGLNPPPLETAKILELGCGIGVNLLNFAETYPKSQSLGVDLSKTQIELGKKFISDLKIKNAELKALSILDLDESYGKFDYIVCHGVYSWVPEEVQDKILKVCNKLLNPNGIAFVSYNTLPGWNMQRTIREMIMFHSELFNTSHDKLQQAKLLLKFINDSLESSTTPYSNFLRDETKLLSAYTDSYVLHEYLGEINTGIYFHQFIEKAQKNHLNYLGDTSLTAMFIGNLPTQAAEKLQAVNDIVRTEQYMDFITNRKFRSTLLCHQNIPINRKIEFNNLKEFFTSLNIRPVILEKAVDLTNEQENVSFYYENLPEPFISTTSPIMKAILYVYAENISNPISLEQVAKEAFKKLGKYQLQDFLAALEQHFIIFIFQGYLKIFETKPHAIATITEKPKTSEFARYQAKQAYFNNVTSVFSVTNRLNDMVGIPIHEKYILEMLDGTHNIDDIKKGVLEKINSKLLTARDDKGQEVTDPKLLKEFVDYVVNTSLEKFRINYLLVE